MGDSLRDQLVKAGLADPHRARQVEAEKRKQKRGAKARGKTAPPNPGAGDTARAEKAERDRELNRQRQAEARRRAQVAEIDDLVQAHRVAESDSELTYHFTDGRVIRRLRVTAAQQQQLAQGQLAVVRQGSGYAMVPAEVAEKVRARDPSFLVLLNAPGPVEKTEDDPYAQYEVPDDLTW